jgi:hypothetical protein
MDSLREYRRKRPQGARLEPRGGQPTPGQSSFVVQRHDATRLHYDPKGPSLNPADKRLAKFRCEEHPFDYGGFEGTFRADRNCEKEFLPASEHWRAHSRRLTNRESRSQSSVFV